MNDNRQSNNIKNVPPNRPYITNRKFINNMNRFKNKYPPKKFIKRSNSTDNLNKQYQRSERNEQSQSQQTQAQSQARQEERKQESIDVKGMLSAINGLMDRKLVDFTGRVNGLIELKTKYYVDQRINVLENSNDLLTRGANELAIQADPTNAGNSFQFKYNGDSVARITDTGILYCRNLWVNGLNIIATLNSMMNTETETAGVLGDYVKHIELKNGTYELNVKDTTTKHLALTNDDNTEEVHLNYDDTNNNLAINFNNEAAKYMFYNDKCEFLVLLTVTSIASGNILGTNIYASTSLTVDGTALITQLDVANTTKNTWYAKFRCEDYLANNEYLRMIFKDLSKQANIDFVKTSEGYKLMLYIFMSLAGITITESSIELLGQVNVSSDLAIRNDLHVDHIYSNNQLYIEVNNSLRLFSDLWLDNQSISQICTSSDYANNQKIGNNALITSQAVQNAIADYVDPKIPSIDPNVEHLYNHTQAIEVGNAITISSGPTIGQYLNMASCYNPTTGVYCFIGENHSQLTISYDGFQWWITASGLSGYDWKQMIWDGEKLVMIAANYNKLAYSYTGEGSSWQESGTVLTTNTGWTGIAYSRSLNRYVCCNNTGDFVVYGNNFNNQWTVAHTGISGNCRAIAYGDGVGFVVVGEHEASFSTDGITWNVNTIDNAQIFYNVGYGPRGFIATDINGHVYKSTNGTSWSQTFSLGAGVSCYNIAYGGGWYCTTWQFNHAYVTKDLVNWEHYDIGYDEPAGLAYGNGIFVIGQADYNDYRGALIPVSGCYMSYRMMMERIYPVGSIYISMNSTDPKFVLGFGTWTQIVDRFLYCRNTSETTGGSATHTHQYGVRYGGWWGSVRGINGGDNIQLYDNGSWKNANTTGSSTTISNNSHGGSNDTANLVGCTANTSSTSSLPPYITCYAWYRTG